MISLAELEVSITVRIKVVRIYARSVYAPHTQTKALRRRRYWLINSGIHDRLVKLHSLIDQTCFEFIDVSYFGTLNFLCTADESC